MLGPSGCGKSTLLRLIAGLERADGGEVWFDGARVDGLPPHQRGFGLMFQDYALFPHLNVERNVAFGLKMKSEERGKVSARVAEMLRLVNLEGFARRDVHTLSGGEQQRVALARSLAPGPRLLMLDEPMGALDAALRRQVLAELRGILDRVGVATIYVTHDQEEALALAQHLILMNSGLVVQQGSAADLVERPASAFVARFLGLGLLLEGEVSGEAGRRTICTSAGRLVMQAGADVATPRVTVLVRPGALRPVTQDADTEASNVLSFTALGPAMRVDGVRLRLRAAGTGGADSQETAIPWPGPMPQPGDRVALSVDPERVSLLPAV